MITCKKDIKTQKYVQIVVLSHPLGDLGGNAQGSSVARWKAHCRLPIDDN